MDRCILCNKDFEIGETGNELGFCIPCIDQKDFPYDLDAYYKDYDNNKVAFKGFETMDRGILEAYRKRTLSEKIYNYIDDVLTKICYWIMHC